MPPATDHAWVKDGMDGDTLVPDWSNGPTIPHSLEAQISDSSDSDVRESDKDNDDEGD